MRVFIVRYNDIKPDATAGVLRLKRFFCLNVVNVSNLYLQQFLQQMLTDTLARVILNLVL